jgi:hypothetical protein
MKLRLIHLKINVKLETHELVENKDFVILERQESEFFILPDIRQNENTVGRRPKFYYLTPDASFFATQKIDKNDE